MCLFVSFSHCWWGSPIRLVGALEVQGSGFRALGCGVWDVMIGLQDRGVGLRPRVFGMSVLLLHCNRTKELR